MGRLLGVDDVNTGHIIIENRLANLLFSLFSLFFFPFIFSCCMPNVSSTPSKSHKATKLCEIIKLNTCKESYEGLLRTKYRICIYPCYVAYMNAMRNKSISRHVRYKLKVSDKTKRCPTQVKDVR